MSAVAVVHARSATMHEGLLYRCYDSSGDLLYVGITGAQDWERRRKQHKHLSAWFVDVAEVSFEYLPTYEDARYREMAVIANEDPIHNKVRPKHITPSRLHERERVGILTEEQGRALLLEIARREQSGKVGRPRKPRSSS